MTCETCQALSVECIQRWQHDINWIRIRGDSCGERELGQLMFRAGRRLWRDADRSCRVTRWDQVPVHSAAAVPERSVRVSVVSDRPEVVPREQAGSLPRDNLHVSESRGGSGREPAVHGADLRSGTNAVGAVGDGGWDSCMLNGGMDCMECVGFWDFDFAEAMALLDEWATVGCVVDYGACGCRLCCFWWPWLLFRGCCFRSP